MRDESEEPRGKTHHPGGSATPAVARTPDRPLPKRADIVIVGNGIAGMTAAVEARRLSAGRKIVLVTEQNHSTVNTPALKQFVIGKLARAQLLAFVEGTEQAQGLQAIRARVTAIDAKSHSLTLAGGVQIGYDCLLLATGSVPNSLPARLPGRDYDGVLVLHDLRDYLDLRRRLPEAQEVVVIGGGVHAAETALTLANWHNIRVHWLIRGKTALSHVLDSYASELILEQARRARVEVHQETEVVQIHGHVGAVAGVLTSRGEALRCQIVLLCTGSTPATDLAERCNFPLQRERGIVVDYRLRSSVPDIFCAGDAAAIWDPQTGRHTPRAQWHAAVSQGRYVAHAMLGNKTHPGPSPFGARWQATQIGNLALLTVGDPLGQLGSESVTEDTSAGYKRMVVVGDRLVGYLSLGREQPDGLAIKQLIDSGRSVSRSGLLPLKGTRLAAVGRLALLGGST